VNGTNCTVADVEASLRRDIIQAFRSNSSGLSPAGCLRLAFHDGACSRC
jgi:hypothetical protein